MHAAARRTATFILGLVALAVAASSPAGAGYAGGRFGAREVGLPLAETTEASRVSAEAIGTTAPAGDLPRPGAVPTGAGGETDWLGLILTLVVGLAASSAALIKAGYAPLAAVRHAGAARAPMGGEHLSIVGVICAAAGVLLLLRGYAVYGLVTNLTIVAAGLYAALDWLQARGLVKLKFAATIRPLGVPMGLACAALVVIKLLCGILGVPLYVI
jgi:hypothetical protein